MLAAHPDTATSVPLLLFFFLHDISTALIYLPAFALTRQIPSLRKCRLIPTEHGPICLAYPNLHLAQVWASVMPFTPGVLRVDHLDIEGSHQLFHHISTILSPPIHLFRSLELGGR